MLRVVRFHWTISGTRSCLRGSMVSFEKTGSRRRSRFRRPWRVILKRIAQIGRVMDFVDVDSDKWRQYAEEANGPLAWVYRREYTTLERYERKIAAQFDASVVVTEAEAELLRRLAPAGCRAHSCGCQRSGSGLLRPGNRILTSPLQPVSKPIVFTGAMDYRANVDAVSWFAEEVFPAIHRQRSECRVLDRGFKPDRCGQTSG